MIIVIIRMLKKVCRFYGADMWNLFPHIVDNKCEEWPWGASLRLNQRLVDGVLKSMAYA